MRHIGLLLGIISVLFGVARPVAPRALAAGAQQDPQTPRFQASVEVTSLDVTVVDSAGRPITNLGPDAFVVRIDGKVRRVVTAEWISMTGQPKKDSAAVTVPDGFSTNENATDGRIIVIAVDQPHIRPSGTRAILFTAGAFIDKLSPADRVAVVGFGVGGPATTLTADRERIKEALARMTGEKGDGLTSIDFNIALAEALAINDGDRGTMAVVSNRECPIGAAPTGSAAQQAAEMARLRCRAQIEVEAAKLVAAAAISTEATIRGLRGLLEVLGTIEAPKTLVLISEGFVLAGNESFINELGTMAAAARTTLYALQLDDESFFSAETVRRPMARVADARELRIGLEHLAGAARGALFTMIGSGAGFFGQLEGEISGQYLLGVESDPRDRDGRAHPIQIEVLRRGATVRSRRQMITAADATRSPRQAVAATLRSPLIASALPLRVATFAFQGPEPGKVQMLIHADVGKDYSDSRAAAVGYTIEDRSGRIVDGWTYERRLEPVTTGVPSALQFVAGASLAPGEYILKLAAAEGSRTGSVEHPIHATLVDVGDVRLSELVVGGAIAAKSLLTPTVGYTASFGGVHGYMEVYGPRADAVAVQYDIAVNPTARALISTAVSGQSAGRDRKIFTLAMPVNRLPPGKYVLRATASAAATPLKTLTRPFEVAPTVRRTSAGPTASELFLPVEEQVFRRPFRRDETLTPAVLKPFRDRVAPKVKAEFEAGLTSLKAGQYPKAEASLKRAIRPDVDSTAALVYLAATFAASGHDTEAAAAWQTALIDGSDFPQIYDWLAESLIRSGRPFEARAILEEATGKWPSDARFHWPLATVYAALGAGPEALTSLERHLKARPADREALQLGVEWIYHAHASGRTLRTAAEDLRLAHAYADAYTKAGGPQSALVAHWVEFLDRDKR